MNVVELYNEWNSLNSESIGFQRAGIDDRMTSEMMKRDTYVFNRIKEIEKELFPKLQDRITLRFNNCPRREYNTETEKYSSIYGYIVVENKMKCDEFACHNVSGTITFAKKPNGE